MACEECKGRVKNPYWILQYGYRPGRDPKGPIRDLVHPKAFYACDTCVAKIPAADRKPDHGRLGLKTGRVVLLNRYKVSHVEGHWARSSTEEVKGHKTVFLSVSVVRRRLPILMARMERADRVRMKRGLADIRRYKTRRT